ncbi:50S ribosomal protein L13 [Candidatus Pacearchaeota archaeon CG10_big_fil_rev_8_21_14_0_10_30_48]|nr:MAG: 50S ribosomal protein L13 [Candidatus Pacearchaeota archaeon CG10_big_fil_rev_8_21_14_0_10_30_48]
MEDKIIIDGTHATMGRLGSFVAKQALLGKKVVIVNANEVVIVGKKEDIVSKYQILVKKGGSSQKGPRIIRTPERILKRVIRGMLPHKQMRGRDALNNIRCYNEIPAEFLEVKKIRAGKEKRGKFILLKELSRLLN